MAGSSSGKQSLPDPSIQARLEGLKILAHHLDEPVVIFNPAMELVYTNSSADHILAECPLTHPSGSGEGICGSEVSPCEPCPGKALFSKFLPVETEPPKRESETPPQSTSACPLPRAVPLGDESGMVHFVVMMGSRGRQSMVFPAQDLSTLSRIPSEELASQAPSVADPFMGESPAIHHLSEMIQLVAASEATVLIQGESGTGKELVARTIHTLSRRRSHPFVVVECSALPETLLESELFGHVRGAFTGAVNDRKGLFEEAEGGTIFLDEIADTSPAFQARLLRVLQEGEIRPVGSNRSVKVNVRVISAGNKPIEELVKAKSFRADLYYRLAVLPLIVPPLRDRREDIPLLVEYFLKKSALKHGRSPLQIGPEALQALVRRTWPGNVRELENLIERIVVTNSSLMIHRRDIFGDDGEERPKANLVAIGKTARQEAERLRILEALREAQGDKTRTARILKISRSGLYNKLREYHISK